MTKLEAIFPADRLAIYQRDRYSAAIRSGELLFVSGQVGGRTDGSPEPDFTTQVRQAFRNLEAVLEAAGCTLSDVVDVTSFHTDPASQFGAVLEAKGVAFPTEPYPAWTAIGVNWLNDFDFDFDFEIKVIARVP